MARAILDLLKGDYNSLKSNNVSGRWRRTPGACGDDALLCCGALPWRADFRIFLLGTVEVSSFWVWAYGF